MTRPFPDVQLNTQKDESGLIELFSLSRLVQTVNSIAIETKNEKEMFQLTINALCIFTGWPLGHIFLRDTADHTVFRCSDIHYVQHSSRCGKSHKEASSNIYDESSSTIKHLTAHPVPVIYRGSELAVPSDTEESFRVLIPIVSRGKLFGFFELAAREGGKEPNQHLMEVFHQIGYRVGSVLDPLISSKNLERAKANDEAILSSIGEGLIVADSKETIILVNRAAADMLKWKAQEMVGKQWFDVLKPIDRDGNVLPAEKRPLHLARVSGKKVFAGKYEFLRKDETTLPVVITATPVSLEDESMGAIIVFRDTTHERQVEQMRAEMISLTGHQLKAPLVAIRGFVELMQEEEYSAEKKKEFLNDVASAAEGMQELVEDLLNISRIEQGSIDFMLEPVQLEAIVGEVVEDAASIAEKRSVRVEFDTPPKPLPKVSADPKYLNEALKNIISNAIKYTKDIVLVACEKQDNTILFSCRDNGLGIPKDEQYRIFHKFYRASNVTETEVEGTGLGLSITKAIVEKLGGKVWFNSEEGKGTTFYVSLPCL